MAQQIVVQNRDPLDIGPHHAVVFAVNDLGEQPGYQGNGVKFQYAVGLEFPDSATGDQLPRTQWLAVNQSVFPKSTMGKLIAATGIPMPSHGGFDPAALIGSNLTVTVDHTEKDGQTYGDIVGYSKLGKQVTSVAPKHSPNTTMPLWLQAKLHHRLDQPIPAMQVKLPEVSNW